MSPDMNVIESLWAQASKNLQGKVFSSKDDLWQKASAALRAISPDYIKALYASIPARLDAVIAAKGWHTKY